MEPIFVDTFNALTSQLQSNAIHILTHSKRNSEKIQTFTMQLVQFKYGVLSLLENFIKQQKTNTVKAIEKSSNIIEEVQKQLQKNREKLHRFRLHQILKRKVEKQKRESMLGSSIISENQSIFQLERSMILIEKDLGIDNQSDSITQRLGLSTVISRSLIGQTTPARSDKLNECSMMSQFQSLPIANCSIQIEKIQQSKSKENFVRNNKQTSNQQIAPKKQSKQSKSITSTTKKVKKTVFSKMDSGREGLLGNLLEESYNSCLDKK